MDISMCKDIGEGLTLCRPCGRQEGFLCPLVLTQIWLIVPSFTKDMGNWMAVTFQGGGVQRQADSVFNREVVLARGAAAHQQEIKCLRHSLRVMKNSLLPLVKENHHKVSCLNFSFLF